MAVRENGLAGSAFGFSGNGAIQSVTSALALPARWVVPALRRLAGSDGSAIVNVSRAQRHRVR